MPRETIDLPYQIDHLSILDEKGHLDEALEPDLSDDILQRLHHTMLLARRLDERMLRLQRQGRLGTFAPVRPGPRRWPKKLSPLASPAPRSTATTSCIAPAHHGCGTCDAERLAGRCTPPYNANADAKPAQS